MQEDANPTFWSWPARGPPRYRQTPHSFFKAPNIDGYIIPRVSSSWNFFSRLSTCCSLGNGSLNPRGTPVANESRQFEEPNESLLTFIRRPFSKWRTLKSPSANFIAATCKSPSWVWTKFETMSKTFADNSTASESSPTPLHSGRYLLHEQRPNPSADSWNFNHPIQQWAVSPV